MKFNFFSFLIFVFIFSFFNVKDADASFTINRPSTHNIGLVGHWTFDGADVTDKVYDKTNNGNNGYFYNGATTTAKVPGKIGQALKFDGVNDYILLPSNSIPSMSASSVSLWAKVNSLGTGPGGYNQTFFNFLTDTNNKVRIILGDAPSGLINVTYVTGGSTYSKQTDEGMTITNKWYHLVYTFDGTTLKVYIDGVSNNSNGTNVSVSANNTIGTRSATTANVNGSIDEVRAYNRALSDTEVKSLYNQGGSKFNKTPTDVLTDGLVGHWTFDGADVTDKVYDKSSNGNNGYFYNGATTTAKVPGKIGQAINFDGVDDFVNAGAPASLNITGAITVSAWINPKTFGANNRGRIVDKQASNLGYLFTLDNSNVTNGLGFGVDAGFPIGTSYRISSANVVSLNTWQNVVAVYDGTNVTFYKDGSLATAGQTLNNPTTNSNNFIIGNRTADNLRIFDGSIDDVRVYNRALSGKEIKILYLMGR